MELNEFWLQFNNGKKEQLNDTKHGVRKEQVDKKFHNLFDAYDANNDGTLEENEVQTIFGHLKNFAGDNVLDSAENLKAKSVFAEGVNIENADFMGFVKSVSDATSNIISSEETKTSDGGKEIKTEYKDGTTETIAYYSNGDFKWKKTEKKFTQTVYEIVLNGERREVSEEQFKKAQQKVKEYEKQSGQISAQKGKEGQKSLSVSAPLPNIKGSSTTKEWEEHTQEYSPRFIAEKLGVDINTDEGKKILERMSYLPKEGVDQIKDGAELKEVIAQNDLPPNFDNISNVLELMYGVTLRNEEEYEASKPQREKIVQQIQTVGIMSELYARVAEFNDTYTDNQGLFGMGAEGIGWILNKIGLDGENHYQWADSCREFIEKINDFKVLNPAKFEQEFKELTGKDKFNIDALQKMVELSKNGKAQDEYGNYTEEFKQAVKDFSNFDVSNPNAKAWYHPDNLLNGFGEALIMIMTLGWGAETKAGQMLATSTMATFGKAGVSIASKQVNNRLLQGALRLSGQGVKLLAPAITEGTKMYAYTAVMGTATNVANRAIKFDSEDNTLDKFLQTEAMVLDNATGSFGFGAFAGVFGSTVTQKVMQRASRVSQKVGTALSDKFAKGAVDANEVFTTILEKSAPTKIAEVAAFATDVLGFTAFESVLAIVKNLDNFPDGYSVEDLTNIIWEELKSQGYNLGQIKIVAWLMSSRSARMQATKYMKDAMPQLRGASVEWVNEGKDGYKINLPDGRKIECKNTTEYISALHLMVRGETAFSGKFDVRNTNRGTETSDVVISSTQNGTIEQRLEQANDRESFVAIREEIKKLPQGEERTRLMQAYLQKYNSWSADPSRPDIRMQYDPNSENDDLSDYQRGQIQRQKKAIIAGILLKQETNTLSQSQTKVMDLIGEKILTFRTDAAAYPNFETPHIIELAELYDSNKFDENRFEELLSLIPKKQSDRYKRISYGMVITQLMKMSKEHYNLLINALGKEHSKDLVTLVHLVDVKPENMHRVQEVYSDPELAKIADAKGQFNDSELYNSESWDKIIERNLLKECKPDTIPVLLCTLARLSDSEFIIAKKRGLLNCNHRLLVEQIAKLSEEDYQKLVDLHVYNPTNGEYISALQSQINIVLQLSEQEIQRAKEYNLFERMTERDLIDHTDNRAVHFLTMDDNLFKTYIESGLLEAKVNGKLLTLAQIDALKGVDKTDANKIINNILPLREDIDVKTAKEFLNLTEEELEKIQEFDLLNAEVTEIRGTDIQRMFRALRQKKKGDEQNRIHPKDILEIVKQPKELIPKIIELMKLPNINECNIKDVINIAKLTQSDKQKAIDLINESPQNHNALKYILKSTQEDSSKMYFDDITYKQILKLRELAPSEMKVHFDEYIQCFENKDGTTNVEAVDRFIEFSKDLLKNKNYEGMTPFETLYCKYDDIVKYTKPDIDAKIEIYNLLKDMKEDDVVFNETTGQFQRVGTAVLFAVTEKSLDVAKSIITDSELMKSHKDQIMRFLGGIRADHLSLFTPEGIKEAFAKVEAQKKKVLDSPELYVNGEFASIEDMIKNVDNFFEHNVTQIVLTANTFDKEAFNHLLRMRFEDASEYMTKLGSLPRKDIELITRLCESCNIDGKPFMPTQKVEFVDLVAAYKQSNLSMEKIEQMLDNGRVDLAQLNIDLFHQIMKNSGMTDAEIESVPLDKLTSWDTKYAHLLAKEIASEKDVAFSDVLRAGNLEPSFIDYIHNESNVYGAANRETKAVFEQLGMNYDNWVRPSKEHELKFYAKDKNAERLEQIGKQIVEDIETLRQTPVKGFFDKQFKSCIKDGEFVIPSEVLGSKKKLDEFVNNLIKQLDTVWKRAEGNATNPNAKPEMVQRARNTLTIYDHLKQRVEDVSKVEDTKITKTVDITIKMWDRVPQKDIFQGNYSTCCIGMGGGNGNAMPHFVMNTAYNMIELVDNTTGKIIGNALCYYVKDANNKPIFIIDNIEINNGYKPSEDVGKQIRDIMADYAKKVSQDVTGNEDTPVFMSSHYNDVPITDLKTTKERISFVGSFDCDEIYMDLYDGWIEQENVANRTVDLLRIK